MDHFYYTGYDNCLAQFGLEKVALTTGSGRSALQKLKQMFGPATRTPLRGPGMKPSSAPITVHPPGMQSAPRIGKPNVPPPTAQAAPGAAAPPPVPSQWVPPGAAAPKAGPAASAATRRAPTPKVETPAPKGETPKPTSESTLLGAPGAKDVGAAEAAFGGPGQPGRAAQLMAKARKGAVPLGLLGGAGALAMAGGGEEELPTPDHYYSQAYY